MKFEKIKEAKDKGLDFSSKSTHPKYAQGRSMQKCNRKKGDSMPLQEGEGKRIMKRRE